MYCRYCGALIDAQRGVCPGCGAPVAPPATANLKGSSYLVAAIAATAFCCLPFGVVGIVYAAQIDPKLNSGDIAGAELAAKQSRLWTIVALSAGFLVIAVYAGLAAAGFLAEALKK